MESIYRCCEMINSKTENKDKGFSIEYDNPNFKIVFWAIKQSDENNFIAELRKNPIQTVLPNVALSGKITIKFCPFCGKELTVEIN